MTPDTLLRGNRSRWEAEGDTWYTFAGIPWQVDGRKGHLERFCGNTVPGGRQKVTPDTLLRGNRSRWEAEGDTWNAFAGIPWQVDGRKGHLEHFRGNSVPGRQRDGTPGTLLQGFRGRWEARGATWNTFAGIPCQVGSREGHLERFCGDTVAGGQREETPDTLLQGFRARWETGKTT